MERRLTSDQANLSTGDSQQSSADTARAEATTALPQSSSPLMDRRYAMAQLRQRIPDESDVRRAQTAAEAAIHLQ